MAVKLSVERFTIEAAFGVMEIPVKVAGVTVNVAPLETIPLDDALTVELPCAKVVAIPLALTVATAVLLDAQITEPETLPELPSL